MSLKLAYANVGLTNRDGCCASGFLGEATQCRLAEAHDTGNLFLTVGFNMTIWFRRPNGKLRAYRSELDCYKASIESVKQHDQEAANVTVLALLDGGRE